MCPAGKVVIVADSDDYFVAEVQPHRHEAHFIRFGPIAVPELAHSLSEWTTERHRLNARETIVFHADDVSAQLPSSLAEAESFIAALTPLLEAPQPYRDHPYWIGAIAALNEAMARRDSEAGEGTPVPPLAPLQIQTAKPSLLGRLRRWLRQTVVGDVPNVSRMHPRWRDYKLLAAACEQLAPPKTRLLVQAGDMTGLSNIFRQRAREVELLSDSTPLPSDATDADAGFIGLVNVDLGAIEESFRRSGQRIRAGGQILAAVLITDGAVDPEHLGTDHALGLALLASSGLMVTECRISTVGWWRSWLNLSSASAMRDLTSRRRRLSPFAWARALLWTVAALLANLVSSFRPAAKTSGRRVVSSVLIRVQAEAAAVQQSKSLAYKTAPLNDMAAYAHIFGGVTRWLGPVPDGYLVDFSGAMTEATFTSEGSDQRFPLMVGSDGVPADAYGNLSPRLPTFADGEPWFEAANWVIAAREAKDRFVMMTLGANYGAQAVCSYRILQQLNPMPCELVAVEPVPENFERTMRHFRDNGIDPEHHWLVPHALGSDISPILFPIGAPGSGAQNAIATNNEGARQDYVELFSEGDGDTARAALRNLLLHNTTGLTRFVGNGEEFRTEIKLVSAITLRELLSPFERVDYIEADMQQSEIVVFPPFIDLLRRKVRRIHIGTHGKDVHWSLHELFERNGWRMVFSFEPNTRHETALGVFETNDGVLTVVNPDL
jgi:hypothetical protein